MRRKLAVLAALVAVIGCTAAPIVALTPGPLPLPTASPTPTPSPEPTPTPRPTTWPLSGMPLDGDPSVRPIAVRFDNAVPAQPQAGIGAADIVFDTVIEACVSRLLAIYHSRSADPIGAVRSARLYDLQLLPLFHAALAHVGAADEVSQMLKDAAATGAFVDLDAYKFKDYAQYSSFYWRVGHKSPPYNEYTSIPSLRRALATAPRGGQPVNVPDWGFLPQEHQPADGGFGDAVPVSTLRFPGATGQGCPQGQTIAGYRDEYAPTYTYDGAAGGYHRATNGRTTIDESTKRPVLAKNVVVVYTDLRVTDIVESHGGWGVAYSVLPRTTGTGRLAVYREGHRVDGTWTRADDASPFTFANAAGERILLAPGQTWVHIVPSYWSIE